MEAVTGKAIVTSMMRLATEMSSWNKAYATEGKVAKRIEELGADTAPGRRCLAFYTVIRNWIRCRLYPRGCMSARAVCP